MASPSPAIATRAGPLNVRSLWDTSDASPAATPVRLPRLAPLLDALGTGSARLGGAPDYGGLLGKVEEAMVTEDDIEAARRKLGQEKVLTQQQMLREIRERLVTFACPLSEAASNEPWRDSATLLSQFHTFGHGRLTYTVQGIVWHGDMLGPVATVAQSMDTSDTPANVDGRAAVTTTALVFPWVRVSGVREKTVDEASLLMATVDDDLGIAFQFERWNPVEGELADLVDGMNRQLSNVLAARGLQPPGNTRALAQGGDVPSARGPGLQQPAAMGDLIRALLHVAARQDEQHIRLDISKALTDSDFVAKAESMVSRFSVQLAQEALEMLDSPGSGPGTVSAGGSADHAVPPATCTLCYADDEAIELVPCGHRLCNDCFEHLQRLYPTSSQKTDDTTVACTCPWDRCHISSWSEI
ncbi:hypothetical protein LPJ61_000154 [Coemansia biformis]|uniref:RING-type domain-containing protein n=1 Tax=Coemansia biformis TaxID=1286918 RepID=A0A9W7YGQ3_9FUNG|nr:hypothetical protein LPJ61_000154 [Coemansia biformis]